MDRPAGVRTWHHTMFDVPTLAARKRRAGMTASVVIPARDEAATIGAIVESVVRTCVRPGLVDELLVVDSESSDATAARATAAGATVVRQRDVLPDAGPGRGKGEALWKGLAVAQGDLVVFVDGDIEDFDERFVVGLLGPLLDDEVALVKGAYDRPLKIDGGLHAGGGRVTELLARPLLAAFWPELAELAQPLAGEYACRRTLLEQLPLVQGYGVELALLVDVMALCGAGAIGQVDLGRRIHRNQPVPALGRMAFEILHVAFQRAEAQGRMQRDDIGAVLPQVVRSPEGELEIDAWHVVPDERPPLAEWRRQQLVRDAPVAP